MNGIDWTKLKNLVIQWLIENTISRIDAATIQKVIRFGLEKLKELAAETSTPLDDWAVTQLENYLDDAAKIEIIRAFIVAKLQSLTASTPEGAATSATDDWNTLSESLADAATGPEYGSPAVNPLITFALKYILTALIEYLTEKN